MIKGIIRVTIFSAILALVCFGLTKIVGDGILHNYLIWILVFYWVEFVGLHFLSHLAEKNMEMDKSLVLLAGVSARLIIAIIAMVTVVLIGVPDKTLFIINFAAIYLLYLVFEISSVFSNLRSNLK